MPSIRDLAARKLTESVRRPRRVRRRAETVKLRLEPLEDRSTPAATPVVSLGTLANPFIGQTAVPVTLTLTNPSPGATNSGYGPWAYVVLPAAGTAVGANSPNDGVSYVAGSARYLGAGVTEVVNTVTAGGTVTGPAFARDTAGNPITLTGLRTGDQVVFFQYPLGSFAVDQPNATITFNANVSPFADLNGPLTIQARGGFTYGNDALDNPVADPPLLSNTASTAIAPVLYTLTKTYLGPEQETATGPNYQRQYRLDVRVAPGQTITAFALTDLLPTGEQFVSVDTAAANTFARGGTYNGTAAGSTGTTAAAAAPGGTLVGRFSQVAADADVNTIDASLLFNFFVPRDTSGGANVVPLGTGAFTSLTNTAGATGTWDPTDPLDATVAANASANADTITAKSIATQKTVAVVGGGPVTQGSVLEYTINFQVSDYFAFDQFNLPDLLPDGVRFLSAANGGITPTLRFSQQGGAASTGAFDAANFAVLGLNADGTQSLRFDVSNELITRGQTGRLVGGGIPPATGTGGAAPPVAGAGQPSQPGNQNPVAAGATTGTIVFRAQVQQQYTVRTSPTGNRDVKQGDALTNVVPDRSNALTPTAGGRVLNFANLAPTGNFQADTTAATVTVARGVLAKTVYAVNGVVGTYTTPQLQAGDTVTYRLTYALPTGSLENFRITDYLPLPVFASTQVTTFNNTVSAAAPAAGTAQFGPADQYFTRFETGLGFGPPTLSSSGGPNTLAFVFPPNLQDPLQRTTTLDLLFTVTARDQAFADGLFLTNQANAQEGNTAANVAQVDAIVQVQLTEPDLTITKGVVSTDRTAVQGAVFTAPTGPTGVTFGAPGSGTAFTGTITSNGLAANRVNANLGGLDAGDQARFALVVENTGSGYRGAFDVVLRDTLPAGFVVPAGGINLLFRDGANGTGGYTFFNAATNANITGNAAAIQAALFGTDGLRVSGTGPTAGVAGGADTGVIDAFSGTSGRNVLVVTYDLQLADTTQPGTVSANQALTNTLTLTSFAAQPGGTNFLPAPLTDQALVTAANPTILKQLTTTGVTGTAVSPADNGNNAATQATIGETVTYTVTVTLPEGTTAGAQVLDTLDAGLAFVDVLSVAVSGGLTTTTGLSGANGAGANLAAVQANTTSPAGPTGGGTVTFALGTVTNANTTNATPETITIVYRAVVLNATANQAAQTRNNAAALSFTGQTGGAVTSSAANVTLVEPTLATTQQVRNVTTGGAFGGTASGDAGDTIQYLITIQNNNAATDTTAYDVSLADALPAQLTGRAVTAVALTLANGTGTGTVLRNGASVTTLATTDFAIDGAGNLTLAAGVNLDVPPNVRIAVTVSGTFVGATGAVVVNTDQVRWTSLDGAVTDVSTFNTASDERDGSTGLLNGGTLNDYRVQATSNIDSPPLVRKIVVATSEPSTGPVLGAADVTAVSGAVGEVVRFRLITTLAEGTSRNFQLRDNIPLGMAFVNDGTARFAFVSTGGNAVTSTGIAGLATALGTPAVGAGGVDGNEATVASGAATPLTPFTTPGATAVAGVLDDNNVFTTFTGAGTGDATPAYADGADVFFRFGDLTNTDSDLDSEYVVVEFNAVVLNVTTLPGGTVSGAALANSYTVLVDTDSNTTTGYIPVVRDANGDGVRNAGDTLQTATDANNDAGSGTDTPAFSLNATVTVVEPRIVVTKQVTNVGGTAITAGDAGDTVRYVVAIPNSGNATAFNTLLADTLPAVLGSPSVFGVTGGGFAVGDFAITGGVLRTTSPTGIDVTAGTTVTVTVTGTLTAAVTPNQTITNTAAVTYTSLPGTGSTTPNATGSATPGAAGTATGERTGAGAAPNTYTSTASVNLTVPQGTFAKSLFATSQASTTGSNVTIGETVTYALRVTLPEGTTPGLGVTDTLPPGLQYLGSQLVTAAAASNGLLAADFAGTVPAPTVAGGAADGDDVVFTFGQIDVTGDNAADSNSFLVLVTARVTNAAGNVGTPAGASQTVLPNAAAFDVPGDGVNPFSTPNVNVTVVEPRVTVAKNVVQTTGDAGDVLTVTLTATNSGTADAFDVTVRDTMDPTFFDVAAVATTGAGTATPAGFTPTLNGGVLTYTGGTIAAGATATFTFTVPLTGAVRPGQTVSNSADAPQVTTLPGTDPNERTTTAPTATDTITVPNASIVKAVDGTSLAGTPGSSVAVGEVVTYALAVTLPEGTTPTLTLTDVLPAGLTFVAGSVAVDTTGFNGTLPGAPGVAFNAGTNTLTVTFNNPIAVNGDNVGGNNTFTVRFDVRVTTAAANEGLLPGQTPLPNAASVTAGTAPTVTSPPVTVTVVEPQLQVVKSVLNADTSIDGGTTVDYRVVISHTAASTGPAYNLTLADALAAAGLTYVPASAAFTLPVYATLTSNTSGPAGVNAVVDELRLGDTITVTYSATLNGNSQTTVPTPGSTVTNTATVNYSTAPTNGRNEPPVQGTAQVVVNTYSLSGSVYNDLLNDGVRNGADPLITGQTVRVTITGTDHLGNAVNRFVDTTTGTYTFANLRPSDSTGYTITQTTQPAGFLDGRDAPGTINGATVGTGTAATDARSPRDAEAITGVVLPLNAVQNGTVNAGVNYDFGEVQAAALGNFVWEDTNGNGSQDGGEPGLNNVPVTLVGTDDTGRAVTLATTTANNPVGGAPGFYQFANLRPGVYTVTFGTLPGYARTVRNSAVAAAATNSDADPTTGQAAAVTLAPNQTNDDVDAGLYRPVTLGDRVWYDLNNNGVQEGGEPGIVGATVTVTWRGPDGAAGGGDDVTFAPITTLANGAWTLGNLPPGNYTVAVSNLPNGLTTATFDRDGVATPGTTNLTAVSNDNLTDVDFGYRSVAGSIGDLVWNDRNNNGTQDAGEPGLPAVTVTATWLGFDALPGGGDDVTFTTVTNAAGAYSFANLPLGAYTVSVVAASLPDFLTQTFDLDGTSSPNATAVTLTAGRPAEPNADFGYQGAAGVGDRVWYDVNGNGVQEAGEPGVVGATVQLVYAGDDGDPATTADNVTYTTTTGANGAYLFDGIPGGDFVDGTSPNYRVTVTAVPAVYTTPTFDADGTATANTSALRVASNGSNFLQDFGFRGSNATGLGNFVFLDANGSGRQDGGEPGINGVTVDLLDTANNVLATTTTADDGGGNPGFYEFRGLIPGAYRVRFGNAAGATTYVRTAANVGANDSTDSDGDPTTGVTGDYAVVAGTFDPTADQGLYQLTSLGDLVWYDRNGNGVQDGTGEPGIPGATVTLVWLGPDGTAGGGDDVAVTPVVTDATGAWTANGLRPGNYTVSVSTLPAGLTPTFDPDGTGTANTATVALVSNTPRADADFGYRGTGAVGDRVFLDVNANGVWEAGEGIDGVTVTLAGDLNGDGTVAVDETLTTTTGPDGFYQFTNLRAPAAGTAYAVTVTTAGLPRNGDNTPLANTADPDGGTADTSTVVLTAASASNQLQDFGYRGPGRIGDTVFLDVNGNNAPDAGEGITGVQVTLSGDVDGDGVQETFTATTNALGVYDFSNLPVRDRAGNLIGYTVTVVAATLPTGVTNTVDPDGGNNGTSALTLDPTTPLNLLQDFGYRNGTPGGGSVGDRVFLDLNGDGVWNAGEGITGVTVTLTGDVTGDGIAETFSTTTDADGIYRFTGLPVFGANGVTPVSYVVTVVAGTLPAGVSNTADPDGTADNTTTLTLVANANRTDIDFGYRGTGSLGDRVWIDSNGDAIQGPAALEPGLPAVGLTLTFAGQNGTFGDADDVTTAVATDQTGAYTFGFLPPGSYRVDVTTGTLPDDAVPTFDFNGVGTPNTSGAVTLTLGQARTDVDFGYRGTASAGDRVFVDQNNNGAQDAGEGGVPGVIVQLRWAGADGVLDNADDVFFTTTTGANGLYTFPGLFVSGPSDDYRVTVLALPTGGLLPTVDLDGVGTANTAAFPLTPTQTRTDVDFGYAGQGSLSGSVYVDANNDGVIDAGEAPIPGTTLTLAGIDVLGNSVTLTTTTDANGNYTFANLVPGTYSIRETQPAAYGDGLDGVGTVNGTPNGSVGNDVVGGIVLGPDQGGVNYNFGERGGTLSGRVFLDANRDGNSQAAEGGIAGATVVLRDSGGTIVGSVTTTADGTYSFADLAAGTYTVTETNNPDYGDTPAGTFAPNTRPVTLPAGGAVTDQNFGDVLGSLAGVVYLDADANGVLSAGDPLLSGVAVTLTGTTSGGPVTLTTTTDGTGAYAFTGLLPASYTITETQPAAYLDGPENGGTVNGTATGTATDNTFGTVALPAGGVGVAYNFGELPPTTPPGTTFVSGTVFLDRDRDGTPGGAGETGLAGVTVRLLDGSGNVVGTTQTAGDGSYTFTGVAPGTYTIAETQPGGYGSSTPNTLGVTVPATGLTNQNFGETVGSLAGSVYVDTNANGLRDAGEPPLSGVTVDLAGTDVNGNPVTRTATTDATGAYLFTDLLAGSYSVTETQPAAYTDGADRVGTAGGTLTPTDTVGGIPLGAGVDATGYDFGETGVTLTGRVFNDRDRGGSQNGTEPGIAGVTVRLLDASGNLVATTTTDSNGDYRFTGLATGSFTVIEVQPAGYGDTPVGPFVTNTRPVTVPAGGLANVDFGDTLASLAGQVYIDLDNNGQRDAGEPPIPGTQVRLSGTDSTGATVNLVTTADSNGLYVFTDVPAADPNGYTVTETQPADYPDGQDRVGTAGGTPGNDTLTRVPLGAGVVATGYDFGELPPNTTPGTTFVAGTVYVDRNRNATLDNTDSPFGGVTVQLFAPGTDGTLDTGDDVLVAATTTSNTDGTYQFTNVGPGSYRIVETQNPLFGSSEAPTNFRDVTVAATPVTGQNFGETLGAVGGSVYVDANNNGTFDAGDAPLAGVAVSLDGTSVTGGSVPPSIVLTGADGTFLFDNLVAGTYQLGEGQPGGYVTRTNAAGTAGGTVAGDSITGIAIAPGGVGTGYLFGEVVAPPVTTTITGKVFLDRDGNGTPAATEPGLAGVTLNLRDAGGTVVATTTTGADGSYAFAGLTPGTYTVEEVQPAGYGNSGGTPATTYTNITVPVAGLTNLNFGETLGSLAGSVYFDGNANGQLDGGEGGIGGVLVTLSGTDAAGNPVTRAATTDAAGAYTFADLLAGTYSVRETQPAGYLDGLETVGTAGGTNVQNDAVDDITLAAAQNATGYLFGERSPATNPGTTIVAGTVFLDRNQNAAIDSGDGGVGGVAVQLIDGTGTVVGTQTTAADGSYLFTNVTPGTYTIRELQPAVYGSSTPNDIPATVPATGLLNQNFGDTLATVGGSVFLDLNNDGVFQPGNGETPISGVVVTLTGTDAAGNPVTRTTTSDTTGAYTFTDLPASGGTGYTLTETQPAGYADGLDDVGTFGGTAGNDVLSAVVVPAGGVGAGYTFGERPLVTPPGTTTITGTVFLDGNRDGGLTGGEPGIGGVTVALFDSNNNPVGPPVTTNPDGSYAFTGVVPGTYTVRQTQPTGYGSSTPNDLPVTVPAGGLSNVDFGETLGSLGGSVYADLNGDGVRQPNDPGLGGVTVTLVNVGTGAIVGTAVTATDGSYRFDNLLAGTYRVTEAQPAGYVDGIDAVGTAGGALVPTDTIDNVPIGPGVNATGYTFGEVGSSVAGTVYYDRDQNGTYDPATDSPLAGVLMTLRDSGGSVVQTTRTAADGTYSFVGLPSGTYTVEEAQPAGYGSSQNGNAAAVTVGATTAVTGVNFGDTLGRITGTVYRDFNLNGDFDAASPQNLDSGIAGVTVTLLNANGVAVATAVTDANGAYTFAELVAGNYTVVETQPAAPTAAAPLSGFYDAADNFGTLGGTRPAKNQISLTLDADPTTGVSRNATNYDFGEVPPADPFGFVYFDVNRNGVRDANEPGVPGVTITLSGNVAVVNQDGSTGTRPITAADAPNGLVVRTDANGRYEFNPLPPGVYAITEAQPAGYLDGAEQDADPNGPPTTITNDAFSNIVLNPTPIRGPFNFGEILIPPPTGNLPPLFAPPGSGGGDVSKRAFLGSTGPVASAAPDGPITPDFAAVRGPNALPTTLVAVSGGNGFVRVFDYGSGVERFRFQPYGAFGGDIRTAVADVNADGIPDIVTVPGAGGGPRVMVLDGVTGTAIANFYAFDPNFGGGAFVAAGDMDGDGHADIVVTPDAGGGPIVAVVNGATFQVVNAFYAIDPNFRGGLRVAVGDIDGDERADVAATAGPGGAAIVVGFSGASLMAGGRAAAFNTFYAMDPSLHMGFYLSIADANGDGRGELFVSAGEGGGPRVTLYDGSGLATGTATVAGNYYAGDESTASGARVAARDLNGDGEAELVSAPGKGSPARVYTYDALTGVRKDAFYAFSPDDFRGVFVG